MLPLEVDGYYNYKLLYENGRTFYGKEWEALRKEASKIPYRKPKI